MTVFPVTSIQSVALGVPDLQAAEAFYTTAWGLARAQCQPDVVYLRATGDDPYVLALHLRPAASILWVTFGVETAAHLEQISRCVEKWNAEIVEPIGKNDLPEAGIRLTIRTREGYVFRFVADSKRLSDGTVAKGFPLRLSHVNLNCTNIEATRQFFEECLGFRLTDRSAAMAFLRCNSDHHAVVLADSGIDGLNHVAFMMPEFDSLMRGVGRMADHGYPIGWGVGRHGPGDNIFAYFVDPFSIVIEHTAEVLQVDSSYLPKGPTDWTWPPGRTDQWGAAPPKSEATKKAQLAIQFAPIHSSKSDRYGGRQ